MMLACKQIDRLFQLLCLLPLLLSSHTVWAQAPFISYNATFPIGQSGLVTWDLNSFAGPVNLWVQELYPNASVPQVPLDYSNTKGYFLWEAGTNLVPGQYFYLVQVVGGQGVAFKSNPFNLVCSNCAVPSSTTASTTSSQAALTTTLPTGTGLTTGGAAATSSPPSTKASGLSAGAAAGIGVAGGAAAIAIVALIWYLCRRSRKRRQQQPAMAEHPSHPMSPPPQFQQHGGYFHTEPKPPYDSPNVLPVPSPSHHSRQWSHELEDPSSYGQPRIRTPEMRPQMSPPPIVQQAHEGQISYAGTPSSPTRLEADDGAMHHPAPRSPARDAFNIYPPQVPSEAPSHSRGPSDVSSQEASPNPETGGFQGHQSRSTGCFRGSRLEELVGKEEERV